MGGDFGLTRMTMSVIRAHQRDSERQRKYRLKSQAIEAAEGEVEEQENHIRTITSFHKECPANINWQIIANAIPPGRPIRTNYEETQASLRRKNYVPNFWVKLVNLTEYRIKVLEANIERARKLDEMKYNDAIVQFKEQYEKWEEDAKLAKNILNGNLELYKSVIQGLDLWSELKEIGKVLNIEVHNGKNIEISLQYDRECVPQYRKRVLKRGDISLTSMPIGLYNEICYNYVCSSVIRVIRETFAALPVDFVQVNVISNFVNTVTGHSENYPILSVKISRDNIKNVEWGNIDPTRFIQALVHKVDFKKTKGLGPVTKL